MHTLCSPWTTVRTRRASSRPRDNGKMNAKWRTQRHLSIRDLDWRSLFLSDSLFHAIDDHIGLRERSGSSFLLLFFSSSSSSPPFCLFLSKRLHNNRPYCDHGALLNLNYYAQKKFSCLPASPPSLTREFTAAYYDVWHYKRTSFAAGTVSLSGFLFFLLSYIFFFSCSREPLRNHRNGWDAVRVLSNFLHVWIIDDKNVSVTRLSSNIYFMQTRLLLKCFPRV